MGNRHPITDTGRAQFFPLKQSFENCLAVHACLLCRDISEVLKQLLLRTGFRLAKILAGLMISLISIIGDPEAEFLEFSRV